MIITKEECYRKEVRQAIEGSDNKVVFYKNECYIIEPTGRIISDIYENISNFINGLAVATKNGRKRIINSDGVLVIKYTFDNAYIDKKAIRICKNGKWGIASYSGKILLKPTYLFIEAFNKSISRFRNYEEKWGIIDLNGKVIIPAKYSYLGSIINGCIVAEYKMYGVIDLHRNIIVPFKYRTLRNINGVITLSNSFIKGDNDVLEFP